MSSSPDRTPVRLSRDLVAAARREAGLHRRSVADQIEHWARIGQAVEALPTTSVDRVRRLLAGTLSFHDLTADERRIALGQASPVVERGQPRDVPNGGT